MERGGQGVPKNHQYLISIQTYLLVVKYLYLKILVWALTKSHCIGMSNFVGMPPHAEEASRCRSARAEEARVLKKHTCWRRTQRRVLNKHNWKKAKNPKQKKHKTLGKKRDQAAGNQRAAGCASKNANSVSQQFQKRWNWPACWSFVFFCGRVGLVDGQLAGQAG